MLIMRSILYMFCSLFIRNGRAFLNANFNVNNLLVTSIRIGIFFFVCPFCQMGLLCGFSDSYSIELISFIYDGDLVLYVVGRGQMPRLWFGAAFHSIDYVLDSFSLIILCHKDPWCFLRLLHSSSTYLMGFCYQSYDQIGFSMCVFLVWTDGP